MANAKKCSWFKLSVEEQKKLQVLLRESGKDEAARVLGSSPVTLDNLAFGGTVREKVLLRIREKLGSVVVPAAIHA